MLTIKFLDSKDTSVSTNAEVEFNKIDVVDTPIIRKIMQDIDKAVYYNSDYFIDRFGAKIPISFLSTGCKAAIAIEILAMNGVTKAFDTIECGINAKNAIIKNCRNGNILMRELGLTIPYSENDNDIDVKVGMYRFTTISRLNQYLFEENRDNPDLNTIGIEKLQ